MFPVKCSLVEGITELGYWCLMLVAEALTAEHGAGCSTGPNRKLLVLFFFPLVRVIGGNLSICEGLNSPW